MKTNCPNCNAPIDGIKCPYCGTVFYDFAALSTDEPVYVRIKSKGKIYTCLAIIETCDITVTPETWEIGEVYGSYPPKRFFLRNTSEMDIRFNVIPDKNNILWREENQ